jgi:hypothetical protein
MQFPSWFPRLFHPPVYQGKQRAKNYFEGWYYKHVDATGKHIWSIIFGISRAEDSHSFIQVIEGKTGETDYIRFAAGEFSFDRRELFVTIGENTIRKDLIRLDLAGDKFSIKGCIDYRGVTAYPQKLLAPGIMGWYTYAPFMECYHGVVSMNHSLHGALEINGKVIDFTGGKGYIEKDWGRSMPSDWIWMQCNHFSGMPDASMMISVARIPWLTGHFPGFLSFFSMGDKVYRFATYNRSEIERIELQSDKVELQLTNRKYVLEVIVERKVSGQLMAPVKGQMERKIAESLDADLTVRLSNSDGGLIYEGKGEHAGLEIVGDVTKYIK